jgi:ABC-type antimicrobial peptide transport system permease subunit
VRVTARVLRQLLTESAVLAAGGVVLGVASSTLSFGYLARLIPGTFPGGSSPASIGACCRSPPASAC